jgi:DNA polymerase III subunit delta
VKANEAQIARLLDRPDSAYKLILLHGPDEAGSRALSDRLGTRLGPDAERVDLDGPLLKEDPARLPDEATAITMFGGPRWIRLNGGDEVLRAVEALLDAPQGCPVVLIAGNLRATSALLKLALTDPRIAAYASWKPEGSKADAIVMQIGRTMGVRLSPDAARMVAEATAADRALMMRELEKLALYVDAAPDRPRPVERADVSAIGAAIDVREAWDMVDALFDGHSAQLAAEISGEAAADVIPALRAVDRRALVVARTLAARKGGSAPRTNAKEKEAADRQARLWSPALIARAHAHAMAAEAAIKQSGSAGDVIARQAMFALSRAAERRR